MNKLQSMANLPQTDDVTKIYELFSEFRDAYDAEWCRLEKCEKLYMGKHWEDVPLSDPNEPRPMTPIVQSTIENVRAELADWYPEATILADDPQYAQTAEILTAAVRENHTACGYDREYQRLIHDLLVGGYMVQEVGFDPEMNRGLGGAYIRHVDNKSIMLDPQAVRVEDCRAIFKFAKHPMNWFYEHYPKQSMQMQEDEFLLKTFTDGVLNPSDSESALLIECWFREYNPDQRRYMVHMVKVAGHILLEDSRDYMPQGLFKHGEFPFVVTPLFFRKGCCLGYGLADMFEWQQRLSDKLDQIVMKNALMASHNKLFVSSAAGFDISELSDWSREVHMCDNINGVKWFPTAPLPGYITSYIHSMRENVKEEAGANDFSRGGIMGGVTAASAILALQEMSNKRARNVAKNVHTAFADAVRIEIEIERQYSAYERPVNVKSGSGRIGYSNAMLMEEGKYPLEFSVSVKVQKENRFSTIAHNDTIMKLVETGMITPEIGLEMLIFDGKEEAVSKMRDSRATHDKNTKKVEGSQ